MIALVFHATLPSGVPRIVNAWRRLQKIMAGPGWGRANARLVNGIYHGPICLPIPINTVYVGFSNQEMFLRPSPWCNLFAYFTEDGQEANWIFAQFGRSRTDRVQWLSPILAPFGGNSIPDSAGAPSWYVSCPNLQNPLFFAVVVGLLLEGREAVLNLSPLDVTIQVKLAQSQQRVKGYWIWIQSQLLFGIKLKFNVSFGTLIEL